MAPRDSDVRWPHVPAPVGEAVALAVGGAPESHRAADLALRGLVRPPGAGELIAPVVGAAEFHELLRSGGGPRQAGVAAQPQLLALAPLGSGALWSATQHIHKTTA